MSEYEIEESAPEPEVGESEVEQPEIATGYFGEEVVDPYAEPDGQFVSPDKEYKVKEDYFGPDAEPPTREEIVSAKAIEEWTKENPNIVEDRLVAARLNEYIFNAANSGTTITKDNLEFFLAMTQDDLNRSLGLKETPINSHSQEQIRDLPAKQYAAANRLEYDEDSYFNRPREAGETAADFKKRVGLVHEHEILKAKKSVNRTDDDDLTSEQVRNKYFIPRRD